ncbi:hypothetical protein PSM36_3043 [Proteiniphilum saccharofermentans]|uniref:Uncharacterized protein n=1 Tax=Proteiniphilum saccharofermentans TaxID=1642647 RepID=A0A1R3T6H8_9BACT|nr:hypothetical protein PSM36_3043 [Proteiniphilum saccharofermentans]
MKTIIPIKKIFIETLSFSKKYFDSNNFEIFRNIFFKKDNF